MELTLSSHHTGLSAFVTVLRDGHCQLRWSYSLRWLVCVCVCTHGAKSVQYQNVCADCACACSRASACMCIYAQVQAHLIYAWSHMLVCWGPWMYPPAGDQHVVLVISSLSGRQRETAGHWCWRFGSERGVCYGPTTPLLWAVQSHHHRRKL